MQELTAEQQQKLIRTFNRVNSPLLTNRDIKRLKYLCRTHLTDYREHYNIMNIAQKTKSRFLNTFLVELMAELEEKHKQSKTN